MTPFAGSTGDVPDIEVTDGSLDVSGAQWSLGLPTIVFLGTYTGAAIGKRFGWEALDANGNVLAQGELFGALDPNLPTRLSIPLTPEVAPRVAAVQIFPLAVA